MRLNSDPASPTPDNASSAPANHVIVCGLGHVGYRIVRTLIRLGHCGTVIARQVSKDWQAAVEPNFCVIVGDAREDELLRGAGIERAKAILAVTDDDLANVAIALDARRLNPGIAITLRIFDQNLAAHLEKSLDINRALSTSALAAPAFMAAALGESIHGAFETENTSWILEIETPPSAAISEERTLAQLSGPRRTPIAIDRGDGLTIRPAAEAAVLPGDRVIWLSPAAGNENAAASATAQRKPGRTAWLGPLLNGARQWWGETPIALRATLFFMAAVIALSVGVFSWALKVPLVDALYFVVTTITTVGYGDYNLQVASPLVKLYGCVVMFCGVAILAMVVSLVTDLLLQTRLRDVIAHGSSRFKDHIIVVGLGNIGYRLVQSLLHSGEQVVAIERWEDGDYVQSARELVPVVLGNAKMEETLQRAGLAGAKALLAVTDDDVANLSIALATKRARPDCRVVTRIFDSTLAEKMEHTLGIDAVLNVSSAAAPAFIGSILCPGVLHGLVLHDHLLLVFHRTVGHDGGWPVSVDCQAGNEAALWVRAAGTAVHRVAASDYQPSAGDQIVGVWWRQLSPKVPRS